VAAGDLDAYLTFEDGWYGKGQSKRLDVYGETRDVFENEYGSIQIKRYDMGFKHDTKTSEETSDPSVSDSIVADPQFEPIKITKSVDISTPYLLQAIYVGCLFKKAYIWQKKAGTSKERSGGYFFKIELRDVSLTELNWSASEGVPEETFSLEYRGIKLEYLPQTATGALDKSATASTDMLMLPKAKNTRNGKDKSGGSASSSSSSSGSVSLASMSTSDANNLIRQVTDAIRRNNPRLGLR
jgi:type VI secretion system Hcp family effector